MTDDEILEAFRQAILNELRITGPSLQLSLKRQGKGVEVTLRNASGEQISCETTFDLTEHSIAPLAHKVVKTMHLEISRGLIYAVYNSPNGEDRRSEIKPPSLLSEDKLPPDKLASLITCISIDLAQYACRTIIAIRPRSPGEGEKGKCRGRLQTEHDWLTLLPTDPSEQLSEAQIAALPRVLQEELRKRSARQMSDALALVRETYPSFDLI
jgi:hypothetical protein